MFDLHLHNINLHLGEESLDLPGFLALAADKRSSRIRKGDMLVLLLSMNHDTPLDAILLHEILNKTGDSYFHSDGSVTSGIRTAVEYINKSLVNHNLKKAFPGSQVVGILNLAVVHDQMLYFAHAGSTHTIYISGSDFEDCFDSSSSERGLGISQSVSVKFFQQPAVPNCLILLTTDPPAAWKKVALADSGSLGLESLHRRLLNQAGLDLEAATFKLAEGSGQILWRKLALVKPSPGGEPETSRENIDVPTDQNTHKTGARPREGFGLDDQVAVQENSSLETKQASQTISSSRELRTHPGPVVPRYGIPNQYLPAKSKKDSNFRRKLASWWLAGKTLKNKVNSGTQKVTSRVTPGLKIKIPSLSTSTMLFIAIAIPLVIVAIGATVYIQRGRSVRHNYYVEQAQELVVYAQSESDKAVQLIYWQQALGFIIQAEENGTTTESRDLRNTIQTNLDAMQGISRVTLQPALFENLPSSVNMIKIISSYDGIYALDSSVGRILHFTRKDQNTFQVDYEFICGPVGGSLAIGPLVDAIILPINDIVLEPDKPSGASAMGIDASGNLIYCSPGKNPISKSIPAPSTGWGKIQAIAINEESLTLYVLDVKNSKIWIYESNDLFYENAPSSYFDRKQPKDLAHMVNLAVNSNDIYLLNEDNSMTRCVYSVLKDLKATDCPQDPAQYQDLRSLLSTQPLNMEGIQFVSMQLIRLPDSALYLLNIKEPALYKFGFQLNLFRTIQFSPSADRPTPNRAVTGFGLTSDQLVFLAYGDKLFFGRIP